MIKSNQGPHNQI